jgi:hypothetical protein
MAADPRCHCRILAQVDQITADALVQGGQHGRGGVIDAHLVSGTSEDLCDTVAHETGADDRDACL